MVSELRALLPVKMSRSESSPRNRIRVEDDASSGGAVRTLVVPSVREGAVTLQYPMLTKSNYGVWTVKIIMRA